MNFPWRVKTWTLAAISLLVITAATPLVSADAAKPVIVEHPFVIPPESLEMMWTESDAVVRVRILSNRVQAIGTDPVHAYTEATADILKVYKGKHAPHTTIKFLQSAGEVETPTRIIRVEEATPLDTDREYVVFLTNSAAAGGMFLSHDLDGAFEIHDGVVIPRGRSNVAQEHRGLSERRFVDELDRLRDRGATK